MLIDDLIVAVMDRSRRYHKVALALGWLANLVLWILVFFVLIRASTASTPPPGAVIIAFAVFILCFVLYTIALALFLHSRSYLAMIMTIVFLVAELITVLITTVTLFADDRILDRVTFNSDPVQWVQNRRWLPIAFAVAFFPIFAAQLFVINRYSPKVDATAVNGGGTGRNNHHHHQEEHLTSVHVGGR